VLPLVLRGGLLLLPQAVVLLVLRYLQSMGGLQKCLLELPTQLAPLPLLLFLW